MNDEIIEKCLQLADSILFDLPEDLEKQPNVIAIGFKEIDRFIKDVADHLKNNDDNDYTMFIEPSGNMLSFSIINKKQAKVFNVKNIRFDNKDFDMFKKRQKTDGKFVFTFYIKSNNGSYVILPHKNNQPFYLLINGYTLPSQIGGTEE